MRGVIFLENTKREGKAWTTQHAFPARKFCKYLPQIKASTMKQPARKSQASFP